ncbi:MAG: PDZ domain-containing protein [Deltaproteobacteria bacterium]|nr:PDZ domain-containing protein [Deltaproteobacteria bacterium]
MLGIRFSRDKADLLVRRGADVNAPSGSGGSLLGDSTLCPEFLVFLLKNGASFRFEKWGYNQGILADVNRCCTEELLDALVQRGANLDEAADVYGYYTPLGEAISRADEKCVGLLLEKGVSTDVVQREPNHPPRSALYVALSTLDDRDDPLDKAALRRIVRLLISKGATLKPGKKLSTSAFFTIPESEYGRQREEMLAIARGEGRYMFRGEGPSFFDTMDMIRMLEQDDAALEEATRSPDPAIRAMALSAHLSRVREIVALARSTSDLYEAHDHCKKALALYEASYRPLQLDVVPRKQPGGQDGRQRPTLGIVISGRESAGVYVQRVVPGGAAERAGLKAGDIILAMDAKKITETKDVLDALAALPEGMPVRLTFLRDEPMQMPDLILTCGLVEKEIQSLHGHAEMNLSRWLAANPKHDLAKDVRKMLKKLAGK